MDLNSFISGVQALEGLQYEPDVVETFVSLAPGMSDDERSNAMFELKKIDAELVQNKLQEKQLIEESLQLLKTFKHESTHIAEDSEKTSDIAQAEESLNTL